MSLNLILYLKYFISRLAPGLRGLGYGMITIPAVMNFYYTVIMAFSFYYLFMGFAPDKQLPWSRCNDDSINTMNCYRKNKNDIVNDLMSLNV